MARTRRGECVHPSRAHVGAGDQTPLLDGGRCRCAISLLRWGARKRVGEEHEGRKKTIPPGELTVELWESEERPPRHKVFKTA